MVQFIFWVLVLWFLIHYGILSAFLVFCANVFMFIAGVVA
jgi:integral membrane sensor domain MASE1